MVAAILAVAVAFVPAVAASQGLVHDHDRMSSETERRVVLDLLADLSSSEDRAAEEFLRLHFVLDGDEDEAASPISDGFCCAGIGAICGVALLQDVVLKLLQAGSDFGWHLLAQARSVRLSSLTPPPRLS